MAPRRIHITGASGSGTTTLGRVLAVETGALHLDTDDFYWLPTDPPFREKRPVPDRLALLEAALGRADRWVLTGSLIGWGDPLIPRFDLAVFLHIPPELRLERLQAREVERYGAEALAPGGAMHVTYHAFLDWAEAYDVGTRVGRNLEAHNAWLARLPCPVLRIEGDTTVEERVRRVLSFRILEGRAWRG
ncbi:AAA family ATPase [Inquilinus sp. NPDC058860]|uniref:ATP-binding protein n=1 Tax=Inquilinus sp. NPDC058860 TaxID=3346652 RepID=UPI0036CFDB56